MATAAFAVELPTTRQSKYYQGPAPNVHDPNYIPVLNGAHLRVDFSQPSFSAIPSIPTPHTSESQTSLKRTKSAYAPETVIQKYGGRPIPARSATTSPGTPQEIGSSHQPDRSEDARSSRVSCSDSSATGGPANVLEEHVFMIPGNSAPKAEGILFPTAPTSTRSSMSMTRKTNVPTSKYSKNAPSVPNIPLNTFQDAQPLPDIQRTSPETEHKMSFESARSTPMPPSSTDLSSMSVIAPPPPPPSSAPRSHVRASTASERRARALHSHPSNMSLKSRKNSTLEETDELPLMSHTLSSGSRTPSVRSRTQSLYNSTQPTPAPSAPLPDLPVGAKRPPTRDRPPTRERPPTRDKPLDKSGTISSPPPGSSSPGKPQNDHMEMAEFMTTQKTTVFRRFDEIHVRLLLQLQDEITTLEKALKEIEEGEPNRPERPANKAYIMRDLRKLLAEYGKSFLPSLLTH